MPKEPPLVVPTTPVNFAETKMQADELYEPVPRQIELQVRSAVANYFCKVEQEAHANNPALYAVLKNEMNTALEDELESLVQQGEEIGDAEKKTVKDLQKSIFESMYSLPKRVEQIVDSWIKGARDFARDYNSLLADFPSDGSIELRKAREQLERIRDGLIATAKRKDRIIYALAQKAQQEGLEKATMDTEIAAAVRNEFPTPKDYLNMAKDLFVLSQEAIALALQELDVQNPLQKIMGVYFEKAKEQLVHFASPDIKKIYS